MNAAEQARSLEVTTKIAAVVNLFKLEFADARADLKPWQNDPDTRELVDPDSIDIGFHLPGWSRKFQSRSILVQIRLYEDPLDGDSRRLKIGSLWGNLSQHRMCRKSSSTFADRFLSCSTAS
jgi:hypothetical protein